MIAAEADKKKQWAGDAACKARGTYNPWGGGKAGSRHAEGDGAGTDSGHDSCL